MNILVIPSWYPTTRNPFIASFCKEMPFAFSKESFGVVYVEAMAFGKPVIGTKNEDIIVPKAGILITKINIANITRAMIEVIENYDKYDSLEIRNYFLENYSKKVVMPQYLELYKASINQN